MENEGALNELRMKLEVVTASRDTAVKLWRQYEAELLRATTELGEATEACNVVQRARYNALEERNLANSQCHVLIRERDAAIDERDAARKALAEATEELVEVTKALNEAQSDRDDAFKERDRALGKLELRTHLSLAACDRARAERDIVARERDEARAERDELRAERKEMCDGRKGD